MQENTSELESKLSEKEEQLSKLEEAQEKKVIDLETMNMMTKYQIVYLKLETSLKKITTTLQARMLMRKQRAFEKMRMNAVINRKLDQYNAVYLGR